MTINITGLTPSQALTFVIIAAILVLAIINRICKCIEHCATSRAFVKAGNAAEHICECSSEDESEPVDEN